MNLKHKLPNALRWLDIWTPRCVRCNSLQVCCCTQNTQKKFRSMLHFLVFTTRPSSSTVVRWTDTLNFPRHNGCFIWPWRTQDKSVWISLLLRILTHIFSHTWNLWLIGLIRRSGRHKPRTNLINSSFSPPWWSRPFLETCLGSRRAWPELSSSPWTAPSATHSCGAPCQLWSCPRSSPAGHPAGGRELTPPGGHRLLLRRWRCARLGFRTRPWIGTSFSAGRSASTSLGAPRPWWRCVGKHWGRKQPKV